MQIHRVKFRGFGCWIEKEFRFGKGINLFEGPNETGKSTLIHGVFALLYGPKKEGVQKQAKADWYNRYVPWAGSHYGGEIEYSIHQNRFRMIRLLSLPNDKMQLIDLQRGMDISEQFPLDRKKDRLFIEEQIGFSCDTLKRIVFLTPRSLHHGKEETTKQARMIEQLKAALYGQDSDVQSALKNLDKNIQDIGTSKQPAKKLGSTFLRCAKLEEEIKQLKRDYTTLLEDIQQRSQLNKKKKELIKRRQEIRKEYQHAQLVVRKKKLEEIHQKRDRLKQEYRWVDSFIEEEAYSAIKRLEEFSQLEKRNLRLEELRNDTQLGNRLIEDIQRVTHLEEKKTSLTQAKQKRAQPSTSLREAFMLWGMGGLLCIVLGGFSIPWIHFFSLLPLSVGGISFYKLVRFFRKHRQYQVHMENVLHEVEEISLRISEILKYWGAETCVALREVKNKQNTNVDELIHNEQKMERIHQEIKKWLSSFLNQLPPFHPEQWIREIRLLLHQTKEFHEAMHQLEMKKLAILREREYDFTIAPSKEMVDLQELSNNIEHQLMMLSEDRGKLEGRIEKMSDVVSCLSQKEMEWEVDRQEFFRLESERSAYILAKEVLLESASEVGQTMSSQLIPYASKWLGQITDQRYNDVLIQLHQGIDLTVFTPETGENQSIEAFSQGTVDQLILSLRVGLLQVYVQRTGIALPLILDDCFVHFDEIRLQSTLELLHTLAEMGHQIILCTCHERERRRMKQLGIPFHLIDQKIGTPL